MRLASETIGSAVVLMLLSIVALIMQPDWLPQTMAWIALALSLVMLVVSIGYRRWIIRAWPNHAPFGP